MESNELDLRTNILGNEIAMSPTIDELKLTDDESVAYDDGWTCNITLHYSNVSVPEMESDAVALKSDIDVWDVTDVKIHDTKEVSRLRIQADLKTDYGTPLSELILETIHGENQ